MSQSPQVQPGDRYQSHLFTSSLMGLFITFCFMFSTLYGLNYYYGTDKDQAIENQISALDGRDPTNSNSNKVLGTNTTYSLIDTVFGVGGWTIDGIFEFFSWINPLGLLLKPYIYKICYENDVLNIFTALNLFLLRPLGWIFTGVMVEFIFNYIRGRST